MMGEAMGVFKFFGSLVLALGLSAVPILGAISSEAFLTGSKAPIETTQAAPMAVAQPVQASMQWAVQAHRGCDAAIKPVRTAVQADNGRALLGALLAEAIEWRSNPVNRVGLHLTTGCEQDVQKQTSDRWAIQVNNRTVYLN